MPPHSKPSVGGERFINLAKTQMVEAARKGGGKAFDFNPAKTTQLAEGDVLIFIAGPEMMKDLAKLAS